MHSDCTDSHHPGRLRCLMAALIVAPLFGCSSSDLDVPEMGAANEAGVVKQHDTTAATRLLTVYLELDNESGYQPIYADRLVVAQPIIPIIAKRAEARMLVQGINTVVVGSSCETLQQRYPEITECALVDSMEVAYGDIQHTSTTDREGFAALEVGQGDVRVSVRSWPTVEDDKCHWSGSAVAMGNTTSIAIPLLVFCE